MSFFKDLNHVYTYKKQYKHEINEKYKTLSREIDCFLFYQDVNDCVRLKNQDSYVGFGLNRNPYFDFTFQYRSI